MYLTGGHGDGGYSYKTYHEFDVQNGYAKIVFSAGNGDCASKTFGILDKTYWLHDTRVDYGPCLDSPQNITDEGYEVYLIDTADQSQSFVQFVNSQDEFLDLFAKDLPKIILEDFSGR